jgi:2-polyprenyl-6-methoxyphenol hydroxylase-like FAD-dependent oxidoreductase
MKLLNNSLRLAPDRPPGRPQDPRGPRLASRWAGRSIREQGAKLSERQTDEALLALVLARAGHAVSVVDIRRKAPAEFRAEKLNLGQLAQLSRLDLMAWFEAVCWGDAPHAEVRPLQDCGARYDRWIEGARDLWPESVELVVGKADRIETSDERQSVILSDGRRLEGRLVVLATGRGERLRADLGMRRRILSPQHSTSLGFSVLPPSGNAWEVAPRLAEGRYGDRLSYASVFPMTDEVRVNVFTYREPTDPWIAALRKDPIAVLVGALPDLAPALTGMQVVRALEAHCGDLYAIDGAEQAGVVLVGDAFHAPCPASGAGMTRILNDIERLSAVHLPAWLATPGMGRDKIAAFYADPVKRQVDRAAVLRSLNGRASAVDASPWWTLRRRFGAIRRKLGGGGARPILGAA